MLQVPAPAQSGCAPKLELRATAFRYSSFFVLVFIKRGHDKALRGLRLDDFGSQDARGNTPQRICARRTDTVWVGGSLSSVSRYPATVLGGFVRLWR